MYKLKSKEPYWFDLADGVQLHVKPVTSALMLRVQSKMPARRNNEDEREWFLEFVKHIALEAITEWSGIGDADGNAADVTKEHIWCLLDDFELFQAFQAKYLADYEQRQQEKNA